MIYHRVLKLFNNNKYYKLNQIRKNPIRKQNEILISAALFTCCKIENKFPFDVRSANNVKNFK